MEGDCSKLTFIPSRLTIKERFREKKASFDEVLSRTEIETSKKVFLALSWDKIMTARKREKLKFLV